MRDVLSAQCRTRIWTVPLTYNLSFTAASLRPELARIIAESYLDTDDWHLAKARILGSNALQSRSASSSVRIERELRQRLQTLTHEQLSLLAHSTAEDRAAMSWLAMLKYNSFAFDFATEVLREKLAAHDPVLRPSDYESFVHLKAADHPEIAQMQESTLTKVRNVLLRMLTEAGILARGTAFGTIERPVLSPSAQSATSADDARWLAGFLVPDLEITRG
jgi:hypothetical protein